MGAIYRGYKRYFLEYESDKVICGSNIHNDGWRANAIKTLKSAIKKIRKEEAENNPRNFVIYDSDGELEYNPQKGHEHAPAVYCEK